MPSLGFLSESVSHSYSDQIAGTKILLSQLFRQNYQIPLQASTVSRKRNPRIVYNTVFDLMGDAGARFGSRQPFEAGIVNCTKNWRSSSLTRCRGRKTFTANDPR
jgi:hypothetical protein